VVGSKHPSNAARRSNARLLAWPNYDREGCQLSPISIEPDGSLAARFWS